MNVLLSKNMIQIVNQEHTYFCSYDDIIYIFSKYGYRCNKSYYFKDHSIFFHFIQDHIEVQSHYFNKDRINEMYRIYKYNVLNIGCIKQINEPFFIVPAGIYGQIIYYFLKDKGLEHFLGFLDNDKSKIGKRMYGTSYSIFKMNHIQSYNKITIIIAKSPYSNEIIEQLNSYNNQITYLHI
jgi:hypothetical protein